MPHHSPEMNKEQTSALRKRALHVVHSLSCAIVFFECSACDNKRFLNKKRPLNPFMAWQVVGNLCRKASAAASDPVALCTGKVPQWLRVIMTECPFLLSHEVRKSFFEMQAYGIIRALRAQSRNANDRSTGGTRQKVRVRRKRMLESAKKVMEMYNQVREL
jgi:hypothetical protein